MPKGDGAGDGDERGGRETEEEEEEEKAEEEVEEDEEEEEEGEGSEDEEDSEEEEEVGIALQLPQRATRGHAYQRLIGEALEEDQAFWGHNTWADEEEDDDYNCSEGEEVYEDVIDSDFDRPEDDDESDSGSEGGVGEGDGRRRGQRGQGGTSGAKQRSRDKKTKREGRDTRGEDDDEGKKTRKQAFELMWKRRQAKREREERQRREKKKQAKREQLEAEEGRKVGIKEEVRERENDKKDRQDDPRSKQNQERKQEGPIGEARQLRMTRGRLLRGGDGGSSTSDEQEQSNSKTSSSQKRKKRQRKPSGSARERGTAREMTLEEHLEEARRTEERNLAVLLAMEERDEARRLRHVFDLKKNMYAGDYDRYFSWASWLVVGDQAAEDENEAASAAATATAEQQQQQQQTKQQQSELQQVETKQEKIPLRDAEETTKMSGSKGVRVDEKERHKNKIEAAPAAAALHAGETTAEGTPLCSVKVEGPVLLAAEGGEGGVNAASEGAITETATAGMKGKCSPATTAEEMQDSDVLRTAISERKVIKDKERKEDQGGHQCSTTASSRPAGTACHTASVKQHLLEEHILEKCLPESQQASHQLGAVQPQQQGTMGENALKQQQQVEMDSTFSSRGISAIGEVPEDLKDTRSPAANQEEADEPLEEAKENEGYAMELRMFTDGKFPDIYMQQPLSAPTPLKCMITGQRAKYRDPLTGVAYATAHAFKCLRESFQRIREKQLLQTMQHIRDVMGPTQSADGGKASITTNIGGGLPFASPLETSDITAAAAAAANNGHVFLASDLFMCNSISSGSSGSTDGYGSSVEERAIEVLSVQQARQRKVAAGNHTATVKRTFVTRKSLTAVGCPQRSRSPVEDSAFNTAAVETYTICRGVEQKRRRNAKSAASCERKVGRSRATRKLS